VVGMISQEDTDGFWMIHIDIVSGKVLIADLICLRLSDEDVVDSCPTRKAKERVTAQTSAMRQVRHRKD
jgi:hypothetical protein